MVSGARRPYLALVAVYSALVALGYLIHALPGLPYYRTEGEFAFWVVVDIVLIVLIARGSLVAIAIPLAFNVVGFLALVFASVGVPEPGVVAFALVKAAASAVLVLLWRQAPTGTGRARAA